MNKNIKKENKNSSTINKNKKNMNENFDKIYKIKNILEKYTIKINKEIKNLKKIYNSINKQLTNCLLIIKYLSKNIKFEADDEYFNRVIYYKDKFEDIYKTIKNSIKYNEVLKNDRKKTILINKTNKNENINLKKKTKSKKNKLIRQENLMFFNFENIIHDMNMILTENNIKKSNNRVNLTDITNNSSKDILILDLNSVSEVPIKKSNKRLDLLIYSIIFIFVLILFNIIIFKLNK